MPKKKSRSQMRREAVVFGGEMPPYCVQCSSPMIYGINGPKFIPICNNPKCPNYGLLQIGEAEMNKIKEK